MEQGQLGGLQRMGRLGFVVIGFFEHARCRTTPATLNECKEQLAECNSASAIH
jgi:hypothetical protein